MPKPEIPKCSICGHAYAGFGHNAQPFPGRCCDICNDMHVIPARIRLMYPKPKQEEKNVKGSEK